MTCDFGVPWVEREDSAAGLENRRDDKMVDRSLSGRTVFGSPRTDIAYAARRK